MKGYWLKFTDGSSGYCQGESEYDAKLIAEKVTGKVVAEGSRPGSINAQSLPYPATPVVWQFDHPVYGKTPAFCFKPEQCKGRTACPQSQSCTE